MCEQTVTHRESYSGRRTKVREFGIELDMTWTATLHSIDPYNLAKFTQGTVNNTTSESVTGEPLPTGLGVGDQVGLANPGISNLIITDSAGTPATLAPQHYDLNAGHGSFEILSLPTPVLRRHSLFKRPINTPCVRKSASSQRPAAHKWPCVIAVST